MVDSYSIKVLSGNYVLIGRIVSWRKKTISKRRHLPVLASFPRAPWPEPRLLVSNNHRSLGKDGANRSERRVRPAAGGHHFSAVSRVSPTEVEAEHLRQNRNGMSPSLKLTYKVVIAACWSEGSSKQLFFLMMVLVGER